MTTHFNGNDIVTLTNEEKAIERFKYERTPETDSKCFEAWRRGNDALLDIAQAKGPRGEWLVGACLAARTRARIVLAALEAHGFFSVMVPVWIDRANAAGLAGRHAQRSYWLCLANAGRDAMRDAMDSARGVDLPKTLIAFDSGSEI